MFVVMKKQQFLRHGKWLPLLKTRQNKTKTLKIAKYPANLCKEMCLFYMGTCTCDKKCQKLGAKIIMVEKLTP